jgi:EpsI family protein
MAGLVTVIIMAWPAYLHYLHNKVVAPLPEIIISDPSGKWQTNFSQFSDWEPDYKGSPNQFIGHFQSGERHVGLYITYYRNQQQVGKLISSSNQLVADKGSGWRNVSGSEKEIGLDTTKFSIQENLLHAASDRLLIWRWFWLANQETASPYLGKAIQAVNQILGKGDDGAEIIVAAAYEHDPEEAVPTLREFITDMRPTIIKKLQVVQSESTRD